MTPRLRALPELFQRSWVVQFPATIYIYMNEWERVAFGDPKGYETRGFIEILWPKEWGPALREMSWAVSMLKESPLDLRGQGVLEKTFGEAQISYNEAILEKGKRHRTPPINMQCHDVWSPNQHQIRTEIHKVLGQDVSSWREGVTAFGLAGCSTDCSRVLIGRLQNMREEYRVGFFFVQSARYCMSKHTSMGDLLPSASVLQCDLGYLWILS